MQMTRRRVIGAAAGATFAAAFPAPAQPRPMSGMSRIIHGFPPGGAADVISRLIADHFRGRLADSVVVESRVGAGGRLAITTVRDAAADGRTLLFSPDSMLTVYPAVFRRLGYDPATDLTVVGSICTYSFALAIGPAVPEQVRTLADFIRWLTADAQRTQFGSPAAGSLPHFVGDMFYRRIGVSPNHVPYRGSVPLIQDLIGGHVPAGVTLVGEFLAHRRQPGLRLLAVAQPERSRFLPDVPTFVEQGFEQVIAVEACGLFLPRGTIEVLTLGVNSLLRDAVSDRGVVEALARIGMEPAPSSPDAYVARLARERTRLRPIVTVTGFSIEE